MTFRAWSFCLFALLIVAPPARPATSNPASLIIQAREARDRADISALETTIAAARSEANGRGSPEAYIRLALFEDWLCEAARVRQDNKLLKTAAEAGAAAARHAVRLDPNSSQAHWLAGDMMGQLIPLVFAGGMRYGPESNRQLEIALHLDSKNANAYVTRAVSYYFAPAMFGGDKQKAEEYFHKAIALGSASDAAASAHIWLAQASLAQGKRQEALREIQAALKIDPQRLLAQTLERRIEEAPEK